jgi:hypothetical protein
MTHEHHDGDAAPGGGADSGPRRAERPHRTGLTGRAADRTGSKGRTGWAGRTGRAGRAGWSGWRDDAAARVVGRLLHAGDDRGDVPGWVLVTLMTAGLVTALWLVAEPALKDVFNSAITGVTHR